MVCITPMAPQIVPPYVPIFMPPEEGINFQVNERQENEESKAAIEEKLILIVEDNPDGRMILEDMLLLLGYQVASAGNGAEALEVLKRGPLPHLILLDLSMPQMNGWEFREQQKRDPAWANIPVVVISAVATRSEIERSNLDVAAFLDKPVPPAILTELIRKFV